MGRASMWRRCIAGLAIALLVAGAAPTAGAAEPANDPEGDAEPATITPEHLIDGLEYVTSARYTVDPEGGAVHVELVIDVRNIKPNTRSGWYVNQWYFNTIGVVIPTNTSNLRATAGGRAVEPVVHADTADEATVYAEVPLGRNLFYGRSREVVVAYDIVGDTPRSESGWQVNPAFVAFQAFLFSDRGTGSVTIEVPEQFEVELVGTRATPTMREGVAVYEFTDIDDPLGWWTLVSARNDDALETTTVDLPGLDVEVRSWPGDRAWVDFVVDTTQRGFPELQEQIGFEHFGGDTLEIRETVSPYLYGYAGWYVADEGLIEVGDELDTQVLLHELSHMWFNDQLFRERWITEGLAQEFAASVADALDIAHEPTEPEGVPRFDPGKVALNVWDSSFGGDDEETEARERYGYNASWYVIDEVADEIGHDALVSVLQAVADGHMAYSIPDVEEPSDRPRDWRRLLDLLEERGGSTTATELFRNLVLSTSQAERLDGRAEARERYATLVRRGATWSAPYVVRSHLEGWRFVDAEEEMEVANEVLDRRDSIADALAELDLQPTDRLELAYEQEPDHLEQLVARADEHIEAIGVVTDAERLYTAERSWATTVGLWWTHEWQPRDAMRAALADDDLDGARTAAAELTSLIEDADRVGAQRFVVAGVLAAALVLAGSWMLVRRRRPPSEPSEVSAGSPGRHDPQRRASVTWDR